MPKHVLIIGAGVIGYCTAYYLAERGHRVTVVERQPENRDGCSFGNAGMIVPSHFIPLAAPGMVWLGLKWMWNPESPFYIKPRLSPELVKWGFEFWRAATPARVRLAAPLLRDLHLASRACFEELADRSQNDFGLVKQGLLMLCKTEHALAEESKVAAQARELGIPAEVLTADETSALDPAIEMDVAGSVYFPKDCHLSPNRFMTSLKNQLDQRGVQFVWNADVLGWRVSGPPHGTAGGKSDASTGSRPRITAIRTVTGELLADEYVLCGGSWSAELARQLNLPLPLQAGKGYSLTLSNPPQLPRICSILCEARVAVTPMGTSLRVGGTMEMSGLNETIDPRRVRGMVRSVSNYYPGFSAEHFDNIQPWRGLRPCSPDGLPYIGRANGYGNLSVATGHSMMGLSLAPVTGKLIAEILSEERPSLDLALLNPNRYS